MLRSLIISRFRALANDTDATNPFFTDADIHGMIDSWEIDLALYIRYPRKQQVIAFTVGDGGAAVSKNLNTDILQIGKVFLEPTVGTPFRISPKTEDQMSDLDPNWRNLANGTPRYYILQDAISPIAASFPQKTITTDFPWLNAGNLRLYCTQMPAASTDGTKSPVSAPPFHETAILYCLYLCYLPRNPQKAQGFYDLYMKERAKVKSRYTETLDNNTDQWDAYESS